MQRFASNSFSGRGLRFYASFLTLVVTKCLVRLREDLGSREGMAKLWCRRWSRSWAWVVSREVEGVPRPGEAYFGLLRQWWCGVVWCQRIVMVGEGRTMLIPGFYFFSTLTFWLSQERPSKMPANHMLAY